MANPSEDITGLLLAADLALQEVRERLAMGVVGSHQDRARIQVASASSSIEMARHHLVQMKKENEKKA